MGFERRSHILSREPGVLPGSEFFIASGRGANLHMLNHLIMCGHYFCGGDYLIYRAYYDGLMIAYIHRGELHVKYEEKDRIATAGNAVFLDLKKPHYYGALKHLEFSWLHVKGEICDAVYAAASPDTAVITRGEACEEIKEGLRSILDSFEAGEYLSTHSLSSRIYEMLLSLLPAEEDNRRTDSGRQVTIAIEYMKYNIRNHIELADIAGSAHLSKYHFTRLFKRDTGLTPYAYLQKLRMDTAKRLLRTTHKTVKEIAFSVGYQSEMGFISAFTEKVGVSPGKYRNAPF